MYCHYTLPHLFFLPTPIIAKPVKYIVPRICDWAPKKESSQNRWGLCKTVSLDLIVKIEGLQRNLGIFSFMELKFGLQYKNMFVQSSLKANCFERKINGEVA